MDNLNADVLDYYKKNHITDSDRKGSHLTTRSTTAPLKRHKNAPSGQKSGIEEAYQ